MPKLHDDAWRHRCATTPFRDSVTFDDEDLVLGHGTVLYTLGRTGSTTISLRSDAEHDRMVALLATAGEGRLSKTALAQLVASINDWRSGDHGLAAIRLVFAPLPRLRDQRTAYRLFLAETALDAGLSPDRLIKELGQADCVPLLKFDPNQPRVPAGSGVESGRWTSDSARAQTPKPIPVFQSSEPYEPDEGVQDSEETEHRFGLPDFHTERSGQRLHLPDTFGIPAGAPSSVRAPSSPPSPARAPLDDACAGSDAGAVFGRTWRWRSHPIRPRQGPRLSNATGRPAQWAQPQRGRERVQDEPAHQSEQPDAEIFRGTPNVTSQAYYLPSPTPDGKTSFDDCKQDDTPTVLNIPNLRPGDMFELKAPGWSGLLSNPKIKGYQAFETQVKNQNAAVVADGRGRQIYYCLGDQKTANVAATAFRTYSNSHFLVCN